MKRRDIFKRGLAGLMTAAMLFTNSAFATLAAEPEEVTAEAVTEESEEASEAFVSKGEEPAKEVAAEDEEVNAPEAEEPVGADYGEKLITIDMGDSPDTVVASVYYNGEDYTLVVGESGSSGTYPNNDGMYSKKISNQLPEYYDRITRLVYEAGMTQTGNDIFNDMTALKEIVFPKSMVRIDTRAFCNCTALESITIPAGIELIDYAAFSGCASLKTVNMEKRKTELVWEYHIFDKCGFSEITIPANVKYTSGNYQNPNGCFVGCPNLKKVIFEEGTTKVDSFLTGLESLTEVVIPDSVTSFGNAAFAGCINLTDIKLPSKLQKLGAWVFNDSGLTSIEIPNTVTLLDRTFAHADNIQKVTFEKGGSSRLQFAQTFAASKISEITLPSRELLCKDATYNTVLTPFADCANLQTLTIEDGAKKVPEYLMDGVAAVKNVNLPDSVTTIESCAFRNCTRIQEIKLPAKIVSIEEEAFDGCLSLEKVYSSKAKNKISIEENNQPLLDAEWDVNGNGGDDPKPGPDPTGEITVDGEKVSSLKDAFKNMKDAGKDYTIELGSDVTGEKNLSIPKTAKSVTINGNGHTITITGGKLTSATDLILEDVNIAAVNKKGVAAKLSINAKKNLFIEGDVNYAATSTSVKVKNELVLNSSMKANSITTATLILNADGELRAEAGNKITVKTLLKGNGGAIDLAPDFNKAITLGGSVEGNVRIIGGPVADGTQIFTAKAKKLPAADLISIFDASEITENTVNTHLYYFSGSKVCIFGESISYNGNNYALWKDLIAQMNKDVKSGTKVLEFELNGDVNIKGAFKLPKKGYESLTINGDGHSITFTGDIKLTGKTTISMDTTLKKVNKKGERQAGKVKAGKYEYNGPQITAQ